MENTMSQQNQALAEQYEALAKKHLATLAAGIEKLGFTEEEIKNPPPDVLKKLVAEQRRLLATDSSYTGTGNASFATAFIWSSTQMTLTFDEGTYQFNGTSWGIGFGGGISWGVAVFNVPPQQLVGDCGFQQNIANLLTQITFWNDRGAVGSFQGAGLAVDASITGGNGSWRAA